MNSEIELLEISKSIYKDGKMEMMLENQLRDSLEPIQFT